MKVLVKLGGTLLDEEASRLRLAAEIAPLAREHEMVVVHGGGKQMTRYLADRGVQSNFIRGLRVTTPEVTDALLKVFAGTVNHQLVGSLAAAGVGAVGLSGLDAQLAVAERLDPELGAVGRIVSADRRLLDHLIAGGFLPVVACVAGGRAGEVFNVNADSMAVAVAAAIQADLLVFLTDVPGVRDPAGEVLPTLSGLDCRRLIAQGIATGGMEAKLNASLDALGNGVGRVVIATGATPGALVQVLKGGKVGSAIRN